MLWIPEGPWIVTYLKVPDARHSYSFAPYIPISYQQNLSRLVPYITLADYDDMSIGILEYSTVDTCLLLLHQIKAFYFK